MMAKKKSVKKAAKKKVAKKTSKKAAAKPVTMKPAATARSVSSKPVSFETAFKYPFNRPIGLLNILWLLIPIIGWLAFGGYCLRIIQEYTKGMFKETPKIHFWSDCLLGLVLLLKAIPFMIAFIIAAFIVSLIPYVGALLVVLAALLCVPILAINFIKKMTCGSFFEFSVCKPVFQNLGDYIVVLLKSLLLQVIFMILSIVLVGIPAGQYTKNIFMADFYRRHVK